MRWNQICLRVMLWALAMSAAAGVALVFASNSETLMRLLWTTMGTAAAAALLWPMTHLADRPQTREAGLLGMAAVLFDFALMLVLIWGEMLMWDSRHYFLESLFITFWFVLLCAAPAVFFMVFFYHPAGWLASWVGVGASALVFVELMAGTWLERSGFFGVADRWLGAAGSTALFGFLCVSSLAGTPAQRPWRWGGVAAALVAWLMLSVHVFHQTGSLAGEVLFTLLTSVAVVSAYANLVMLPTLAPLHEVVRRGTLFLALVTAGLVEAIVLFGIIAPFSGDGIIETLTRIAGAAGIVTACGTIAILVLALINRSGRPAARHALPWVEMLIACPRCGLQQKAPVGDSTCEKCRLAFSIRIGEGRA